MLHRQQQNQTHLDICRRCVPEYSKAIQIIIDFWNSFNSSEIRNKYNYCKHKGKPAYYEIEELRGKERLFGISIQSINSNETTQIASDIRDVQLVQSLTENIAELQKFDDKQLFPYVKSLLEELKQVVKPSPMVM